ncbi:MAG: phosphoribosylformylglycinamidine cyclo-ligase [Thermoplasmata archaeon]|nr:phosphoribosylformylglycinamidine cyclo-ligase [Thermoplasmata archaeon]
MGLPSKTGRTYASVGVDRGAVAVGLRALLEEARYRAPSTSGRPLPLPGHFAGLLRIGTLTVALTTDTIGTKGLLAQELDRWEEVGEDVVAINVNDLAAVGARPAALVDTISMPKSDPAILAALGRGIRQGLEKAECSLVGGETALVPELVNGVDLGATALGFFPPGRRPITGRSIRVGDSILGIPSSGVHANGLTLARRIAAGSPGGYAGTRRGGSRPLGEELLTPTRCYVRAVEAIAANPAVHGLAHISGGGVRNLTRLKAGLSFQLDAWPRPSGIFRFLSREGKVASQEMYQTFNMGIGFVVVCQPSHSTEVSARLAKAGYPDVLRVGRVGPGHGVQLPELGLSYEGYG